MTSNPQYRPLPEGESLTTYLATLQSGQSQDASANVPTGEHQTSHNPTSLQETARMVATSTRLLSSDQELLPHQPPLPDQSVNITENQAVTWIRQYAVPGAMKIHEVVRQSLGLEWYEVVNYAPIPPNQICQIWLGPLLNATTLPMPDEVYTVDTFLDTLTQAIPPVGHRIQDPYPKARYWIEFPMCHNKPPISLLAAVEQIARGNRAAPIPAA